VADQVFPDQKVEKGFQRGDASGIGAPGDAIDRAMLAEKTVDDCEVDILRPLFFGGGAEGQKQADIGRIGRDGVFSQSLFRDEITKVQLEGCGEMLWKGWDIDGASVGVR